MFQFPPCGFLVVFRLSLFFKLEAGDQAAVHVTVIFHVADVLEKNSFIVGMPGDVFFTQLEAKMGFSDASHAAYQHGLVSFINELA